MKLYVNYMGQLKPSIRVFTYRILEGLKLLGD